MMTDEITIFDTTLRDGEQSPGCAMTPPEKLKIALLLDKLGVDVIEAGFPVASDGDFESVYEIAKNVKNAAVCAFARAVDGDIEAAGRAIEPAQNGRINTFIATSPLHMRDKLKMSPEKVLEKIDKSVTYALEFTDNVGWVAEDATRSKDKFLCNAVETAINAGATTITIPDTVGYSVLGEYGSKIAMLFNRVSNIDKAVVSTHCHNDLGFATANSFEGIDNGARQVDCTINGIGERAGMPPLEQIVMPIHTRPDKFPYSTNVDTTKIIKTSRTLSEILNFNMPPHQPFTGENAFLTTSGIHQDGMKKKSATYQIIDHKSVGLGTPELIMTKHSGSHALGEKLKELGFGLGDNMFREAFLRFKTLADKLLTNQQRIVSDDDLIALVENLPQDKVFRDFRSVSSKVCAGSIETQDVKRGLDVEGKRGDQFFFRS